MVLLVVSFGVAALLVTGGFVQDLYRQLGETIVRSQSGHFQVAQEALFSSGSRSPEKHRIRDVAAVKAELQQLPGVEAVSARLTFTGLLGNGARDAPVLGEGIESEVEQRFMRSITLLDGGPLASADVSGAWLGEGLARTLDARPGTRLTLVASTVDGAMNTIDLEVRGVFRSFSRDYDARALKIGLVAAQELLATEDANTVVLLLGEYAELARAVAAAGPTVTKRNLSTRTWEQLNDFYRNTVLLYDRQFAVLAAIILLMVALGVNNAVTMAVLERQAEFGTMRALGNADRHVFLLVVSEVAMMGVAGTLLGLAIGTLVSMLISAIGIDMPPPPNSNVGYVAGIRLVPGLFLQAAAVGVLATFLAGLRPAHKVARTPIVSALAQCR
jgi:putative ABC transport system permease protein